MSGMAWDIIGMMAVGVGIAAALYAASHALRKAGVFLPRWIMPAAIGLGMLSFTIWNEYSWYGRVMGQLPASVEVLETGSGGKAWRPWAFVLPIVNRFAAIDRAGLKPDNFLAPSDLPDFERSHLRDAFVVVRTMQSAVGHGKGALG